MIHKKKKSSILTLMSKKAEHSQGHIQANLVELARLQAECQQ